MRFLNFRFYPFVLENITLSATAKETYRFAVPVQKKKKKFPVSVLVRIQSSLSPPYPFLSLTVAPGKRMNHAGFPKQAEGLGMEHHMQGDRRWPRARRFTSPTYTHLLWRHGGRGKWDAGLSSLLYNMV